MNSSRDRIIAIVLDRLPDSIEQRRQVLTDLVAVFPASREARGLLTLLDAHISAQRELSLESSRGSGRPGDTPIERGAGRLGEDPKERGGRK